MLYKQIMGICGAKTSGSMKIESFMQIINEETCDKVNLFFLFCETFTFFLSNLVKEDYFLWFQKIFVNL